MYSVYVTMMMMMMFIAFGLSVLVAYHCCVYGCHANCNCYYLHPDSIYADTSVVIIYHKGLKRKTNQLMCDKA